MKTIKLYTSLLLALLVGFACSDDDEPAYTPGTQKSSAAFTTPSANKTYILTLEDKYEVMDVFEWTQSEYPVPVGMQYTLEMDLAGNNFESAIRLGITTENELEIIVNDFNNYLDRLGTEPDEPATVELRILTNAFGGEEGIDPLSDFPTITSQTFTILVTPFEPEKPEYPTELYMIGEDFGNWDWDSDEIVQLIPVNGKEGQFWCINYFTAGKGFKWAPGRKWVDDFAALDVSTGFTVNGDAFVPADGLYMVYINCVDREIVMETPQVYGIGNAFGGWDEGLYAFTVSGNVITGKTSDSGDLRMYAGSSIATSDWWTREFKIINGKIVYRADGGELETTEVSAGTTLTLDFAAGTGKIE